jgi:thymidylate synthase ThyX
MVPPASTSPAPRDAAPELEVDLDAAFAAYPAEEFTPAERERLAPHFTNLDRPVFGLVNLPETVKGALFARYSRYGGTLRRLFLDEFADSLPESQPLPADAEGKRARELYERIFLGFGDDSVAQLGGAHVACEWTSNLLTKILQRPRLASYLEQSTRYIAYDRETDSGHRYYRDERLGYEYRRVLNGLFATYRDGLSRVGEWVSERFPRQPDESEAAHARAVRAKTLDLVRGLLPAASLSHVGVYASGQAYEQLVLHLLAHPLPEARIYGQALLEELQKMIPSFVARVPRPDRGGEWVEFLRRRAATADAVAQRMGLEGSSNTRGPSVRLLSAEGSDEELLAALVFEAAGCDEQSILAAARELAPAARVELLSSLLGARANRRHRPGRGLERLRYRFEIVSDYGAFRDLQRHRMLTAQWQRFTPDLGAEIPDEIADAGFAGEFAAALESSQGEYERLRERGWVEEAPYALCLAFRIRFVLDLDAREAMHLIELRSGREGHPAYRAVAHEMHRLIGEVHPAIAAAMTFVDDSEEPRLERLLAEMRNESRARRN